MNLWIRSQNKMNLESVHGVSINYLNKKQLICNYEPDFIGNQGEYCVLLGEYATEERALEVLDEITNLIKPKYLIRIDNHESINDFLNNENNSYVSAEGVGMVSNINQTLYYEMPKE